MDEAFQELEWGRVVEAVRSRCRGPAASEASLPLASTVLGARTSLAETREAMDAMGRGDPLPVDGIRDIEAHLSRVARAGALTGPELRDIGLTLAAGRVLRQFLGRNREHVPHLARACAFDPTLDDLEDRLGDAIERDGRVADHASAELRALRTEVANLRARLVGRLEELMRSNAAALSDTFYTVREGRYVLPMRADAHERIQGIVHGTSQSGATVFVEPRAIIGHGNRLKIAEAEMEREETRILGVLSELVREQMPAALGAFESLNHADLRAASARFGDDLRGRIVPLSDGAAMHLLGARHPVLALAGAAVVPSDLSISSGEALVISGPNAGGKTVALKTLGLAALMVRAGLPLLVEDGSTAGFFDPVFADVGDSQSIANNLSTFSAHMRQVVTMLNGAGATALVLLDELAGGTDPSEGAGLACALVEEFQNRGAAVVVTTHYEALKALGVSRPRVKNASVGFDRERLAPTFELLLGVPGSSSALLVAERFGLPHAVVERARAFVPEQVSSFEALVGSLREQMDSVARSRAAVLEETGALARARTEHERLAKELKARDKRALSDEAQALKELVDRARAELVEARRKLREERPPASALEEGTTSVDRAKAALAELASHVAARGPGENPAVVTEATNDGAFTPELGQRAWIDRLGADGDVLAGPEKGRFQVAVGAMKLWVDAAELRAPRKRREKSGAARTTGARATTSTAATPALQTSDNTLDLRGLRVDEAIGAVDAFLDRLYGEGTGVAYLHHGVGTGALKEAIRGHLRTGTPYAVRVRGASMEEGGDRLTVVEFSGGD
jgi:DNA mismatch repair protein MutS2